MEHIPVKGQTEVSGFTGVRVKDREQTTYCVFGGRGVKYQVTGRSGCVALQTAWPPQAPLHLLFFRSEYHTRGGGVYAPCDSGESERA